MGSAQNLPQTHCYQAGSSGWGEINYQSMTLENLKTDQGLH
jgi:hypothetical protein